jgi:Ca2+/H+ antiporter
LWHGNVYKALHQIEDIEMLIDDFSKQLAVPIDYGIRVFHAPAALGGLLVAALVLSPESLGAARAALANQLQRSVNLLLGPALATISLAIPAVLTIGFITGQTLIQGIPGTGYMARAGHGIGPWHRPDLASARQTFIPAR